MSSSHQTEYVVNQINVSPFILIRLIELTLRDEYIYVLPEYEVSLSNTVPSFIDNVVITRRINQTKSIVLISLQFKLFFFIIFHSYWCM